MKRILKRGKWLNISAALLFITSCIDLVYIFSKLCWSTASLTWFGIITTLLSVAIASNTGEYLYDQMQ